MIFQSAGRTGLARLDEALEAHIWPDSEMMDRRILSTWSEELPLSAVRGVLGDGPKEGKSDYSLTLNDVVAASIPSASGGAPLFDDDFAPFVSAPMASSGTISACSSSPSVGPADSVLDQEDFDDPTLQLSSMFTALSSYREQAMAMPDGEARKDFAAEVALRFARELDAMMGDDDTLEPN